MKENQEVWTKRERKIKEFVYVLSNKFRICHSSYRPEGVPIKDNRQYKRHISDTKKQKNYRVFKKRLFIFKIYVLQR